MLGVRNVVEPWRRLNVFGRGTCLGAWSHSLWELGIQSIVCYTDCANAVSVFHYDMDVGSFWAREEITRVRGLLQLDWQVVIASISRDKNVAADLLARQTAKDGTPRRV